MGMPGPVGPNQVSKRDASAGQSAEGFGRDWALLALIFGVLIFAGLGQADLVNPDEGRYAEIPREMVASGDYVTPRLNGVVYFEKPPLVYWAVAAMRKMFGPSELSMRAAPALFALAGILLTYGLGRRLYGRVAGLAAAMVLGTSLLYFALGRILLLDMPVSVLISATLGFFLLGVREAGNPSRRRWYFLGLYACAALATLAKGLIGVLLPGAVMFLWLLVFNQWHRLRPLHLPAGLLLFLAIAAPWHLLVAQRNPQWAHFYFVHEHWQRFTTTVHERTEPWWYFAPVVLLGLFPWTGCLPQALGSSLGGGPFGGLKEAWSQRKENADAWFLVTWAAFIFLFFSKSQSKLIPYILPVFPPLAVLIGRSLAEYWFSGDARKQLWSRRWFGVLTSALGSAMLIALWKRGIIRDLAQAQALRPAGSLAALGLLGAGFLVPLFCGRGEIRRAFVAAVAGLSVFYVALGQAQKDIARAGTKDLALYVQAHARPGDRVLHYYEFFHDFTFYAERFVGVVDWIGELEVDLDPGARSSGDYMSRAKFLELWSQPGRIFVVARKRRVDATPEAVAAAARAGEPPPLFAVPGFRYHLLAEAPGHYLFSNQP